MGIALAKALGAAGEASARSPPSPPPALCTAALGRGDGAGRAAAQPRAGLTAGAVLPGAGR